MFKPTVHTVVKVNFVFYYQSDKFKEDEIGVACGSQGGGEKLALGFGGTAWKVKEKFTLLQATKAQKGE